MEGIELEVNTKLEVQGTKKGYKSIVLDVSDENFMINIPVSDGEYMLLHIGEEIEINCYLENGRCYNFFSKVIAGNLFILIYRNFLIKSLDTPNIADAFPIASPSDKPEAISSKTTLIIFNISKRFNYFTSFK